MGWGALGSVLGDVTGSLIGGAFNAREASKNRDWQEEMSNTQYQRAAADLEKAGLNRILALGSPAPSGAGSAASISSPTPGSTGIAAASAKQAIAQGKAQEALLKAQALETLEKTRLTSAEAAKAEVEKGVYDALGPAANSLFQSLGSNATDMIGDGKPATIMNNLVEKGRQAITERAAPVIETGRGIWDSIKSWYDKAKREGEEILRQRGRR